MSGTHRKSRLSRLLPRAKKRSREHVSLASMIAVLGLLLATFGFVGAPAQANPNDGGICTGLDSGKIDTTGDPQTVTVTAPEGKLISGYCVKAGSSNQGDGPVYVDVDPPVKTLTFGYPGNKAVSHYSLSYVSVPTDACPALDGNQPPGTDCTQPADDRETRDLPGVVDCESDTYTVEHQERTREYSWDGDSWEPGAWSDWTTYDTTVTEATDEQCPPPPTDACPALDGNQPPGTDCTQPADDRETRDLPGVVDCESDTYTVEHQERTREYSWDGDSWEPGAWSDWTTYDTTVTEATDEQCPPPPNECPSLTGSVKTTLADGSVVDGNIYQDKSDVYISGSQLGDVSTVYIRVTDPSGSTVLSEVKQVSVTDGSFGPVQLPTFGDSPNNGDEYKVWVSSSPDFEQKCTKSDNFKVKGDEPPPAPEGMSKFSVDCESLEIKAPTGVKPEDAEYQYFLDGQAIAVGSHELAPGDYILTLEVNGTQVDSDAITVEECEQPPSYVVTVVPNQGNCDVRTPVAQVTTSFASSIGYRLTGETTKFVYTEVPAGIYTLTLPSVNPGDTVSYEVVVTPLDDSAEAIVKGPFSFSVPKNCDEVPPCTEFQDEDAAQPCYVEREPDVREKSSERESCRLGGVVTTHAVFTTTYSFNEETQQWVTSETATSSQSFEPYSAAELKEKGCTKTPVNPPDDNPGTPNTPTTADTGLWTEPAPQSSDSTSLLLGLATALLLLSGLFFYGASRRGQES